MQAKDVISQLYQYLPAQIDNFSVLVDVQSVIIDGTGTLVTVVTNTPHGIPNGGTISVSNSQVKTEITSLSLDEPNDILSVETTVSHDLTEGFFDTVTFVDFTNTELNGTFDLLKVPNRRNFTVDFTGLDISSPGTGYLLENKSYGGINGLFQATVLDSTTFTYTIPVATTLVDTTDVKITAGIRISGASDILRAIDSYTKQTSPTDLWGFVITDNPVSSKDRNVTNDATLNQGGLNDWNVLYIEGFSFYVIVPTTGDITGRRARDLCDEIKPNIFNSLLGVQFPSGFKTNPVSPTYPLGDDFYGYFDAYYVHQYRFEQISRITTEDIQFFGQNVAFRDIDFTINDIITNGDSDQMTGSVDLDDEPLD